ncbi:DUF3772 domain-containing protein [Variovorax sp. OV329]|uniref:DUF3772 domain-containing protein n=1 Tax=Variovorax sp. OV329 TaxID=1882825 RepID=UPI0008E50FAD|nr:DUF3772 domain-containing protein [Variovorax sp. OV329]SFM07366.1 Small-conductance mechanosensitive channel [Variovorax sp. OV329]
MTWITRCVLLLAALLLACSGAVAQPAAPSSVPPAQPEITLDSLRAKMEQVPDSAEADDDVQRLITLTDELVAQSDRFVAARTTQLNDLNARLGELGPAPAAGGSAEAADITRQRATLTKQRNVVDADIRLARLLSVNAQQHRTELLAQRRAVFEAKLFERSLSPLTAQFWEQMSEEWKGDKEDLSGLSREFRMGMSSALASSGWGSIVLWTLLGIGVLVLAIWGVEVGLAWLAARKFPIGRLRRSLLALLTVLAYVLLAGLAASAAWGLLDELGNWGTRSSRLAIQMVRMVMFLAFVVGLGRAMLSNGRPSWRLPPIPDPMARRLRPLPWLVAVCALIAGAPVQINQVIDDPLNSVLTNLVPVAAFVITALLTLYLVRHARGDALEGDPDDGAAAARPAWVSLLRGLVGLMLLALVVVIAFGYLAFARVLAGQVLWAGIVISLGYLLLKFADDLWMSLLSARSTSGQRLQKSMNLRPQTLDQAAVLMSALSRILVFFYMVIAFIAPLGSTPGELVQRSGRIGTRLKVGEFELDSGAMMGSLLVLVVGFVVLRLFKRWLENSYLPNTQLESGMRSSISTLLNYVGAVVVVALALSALGIGVNRIAWVASALSVGIGFGLQAIVQNFISGLILLAERPVKVGDWVVLGTAEGDVRRINVRATEIQLGDRSTLIVPNSEFITKTVRNMTLANAEGRVLIRLPMPLTTDAQKVREVMLKACHEHTGVLPSPEPGVTLDGVENGLLVFQAIAFVPNPRMAGGVRSDLLFAILDGLREAQLSMAATTAAPVAGTLGASLAPGVPPPAPSPPSPLAGS